MNEEFLRVNITKSVFLFVNGSSEILGEYLEYHPSPYNGLVELTHFIKWLIDRNFECAVYGVVKPYHTKIWSSFVIWLLRTTRCLPKQVETMK